MKIILEFSKNVTIEINVSGVYNQINKQTRIPYMEADMSNFENYDFILPDGSAIFDF